MRGVQYHEINCKTALNRLSAGRLPFSWDLNIYRGCLHGCRYCYAMYSHSYLASASAGFFDDIHIKTNIVDALEKQLRAPSWRQEVINIGGVTEASQQTSHASHQVLTAAAEQARATIGIPPQMPQGAMNAPSLLAELQERSRAYQPGTENHVINFTLLPITEVDTQVLTAVLGQIPLVIRSGGYGSSRVFATGLKHVWAVQYINSMGNVILDTLEVGGVPVSVLAAREDFADSAERLAEILEAFTS